MIPSKGEADFVKKKKKERKKNSYQVWRQFCPPAIMSSNENGLKQELYCILTHPASSSI